MTKVNNEIKIELKFVKKNKFHMNGIKILVPGNEAYRQMLIGWLTNPENIVAEVVFKLYKNKKCYAAYVSIVVETTFYEGRRVVGEKTYINAVVLTENGSTEIKDNICERSMISWEDYSKCMQH